MGYRIEISINLKKYGRTGIEKQLRASAVKNKCEQYFSNIEINGTRRVVHKNFLIITIVFPDDDESYIINFIKYINLLQSASIQSIAYDNCIFKIFVSKGKKSRNILKLTDGEQRILHHLK